MKFVFLSLLMIVAVSSCRMNQEKKNTAAEVKKDFYSFAGKMPVRFEKSQIVKNSFELPRQMEIYGVQNEGDLIVGNNEKSFPIIFFVLNDKGKKANSIIVQRPQFRSFLSEEIKYVDLLQNNEGDNKILLESYHESISSCLKQINFSKTENSDSLRLTIDKVDNPYFYKGYLFVRDSVTYMWQPDAVKNLSYSDKGRLMYTYCYSSEVDSFRFYPEDLYISNRFYNSINPLPLYDCLYFKSSTLSLDSTSLVSFNIFTKEINRYVFPMTVLDFWFAENKLFISYQKTEAVEDLRNSVMYSYVLY